MEELPFTLSAPQVGGLAIAIPIIAVALVNGLKGAFYWKAPVRWQAGLPDRYVWPCVAGVICMATAYFAKMDIGEKVVGQDWPVFPQILDYLLSGVILAVLSSKVFYPLLIAPSQKQKAIAAVAKACRTVEPPPFDNAQYVPPVVVAPEPNVNINADCDSIDIQAPLPEPDPVPAPAPPPVPARVFIELHPGGGPDRYVLVEDAAGQHIYPWPSDA